MPSSALTFARCGAIPMTAVSQVALESMFVDWSIRLCTNPRNLESLCNRAHVWHRFQGRELTSHVAPRARLAAVIVAPQPLVWQSWTSTLFSQISCPGAGHLVDRYTSHVIFLVHIARQTCAYSLHGSRRATQCVCARFIPSSCHP